MGLEKFGIGLGQLWDWGFGYYSIAYFRVLGVCIQMAKVIVTAKYSIFILLKHSALLMIFTVMVSVGSKKQITAVARAASVVKAGTMEQSLTDHKVIEFLSQVITDLDFKHQHQHHHNA